MALSYGPTTQEIMAMKISRQDYKPQKPPFSSLQLEEAVLSRKFIDYMRLWDGFVED